MVQRVRGVPLKLRDGSQITVQGNDVVGRSSAGTSRPLTASDGYALHGTNTPSVGHAVSHGCVRLRNQGMALLYDRVAVGTPVYIY